ILQSNNTVEDKKSNYEYSKLITTSLNNLAKNIYDERKEIPQELALSFIQTLDSVFSNTEKNAKISDLTAVEDVDDLQKQYDAMKNTIYMISNVMGTFMEVGERVVIPSHNFE